METVVLNIGGALFEISRTLLNKYPQSRLGKLSDSCTEFKKDKQQYYFDRNPTIFNVILDFYRHDELHFPSGICAQMFRRELEFWDIKQNVQTCCMHEYLKLESHIRLLETIHGKYHLQNYVSDTCGSPLWKRVWIAMEKPFSSKPAKAYMVLYLLMVLISTVVIVLSTHADFREKRPVFFENDSYTPSWIKHFRERKITNETLEYITSRPLQHLNVLERLTDAFFILVSVIHFAVCPTKKEFFRNVLNIIDQIINVAVLTKYVLESYYLDVYRSSSLYTLLLCCHVIAILRLTRGFRIAVQFCGVRILLFALKDSFKDLTVLLLMCLSIAVLFANMIFYAEFDKFTFKSMVQGIWFSIVTMTTVGYGDIVPVSTPGCILGATCALFGVLILAAPIAIVAGNYTTYYKKLAELQNMQRLENEESIDNNLENSLLSL